MTEARFPESGTHDPGPVELRSLDPAAVTLWRLAALGRGASFTLALLVAELFVFELPLPPGILTGSAAILTVALAVAVPPLRYRAWRFALRPDDVFLRHGILFRTTSIIPHARIQHVDTRHGPVDRWLGLASVVVFTAGQRGAVLSIPALAAAEAESVRDRLAALSGVGDAV